MEENELFWETHEQEENGLFGRMHQAEQLNLCGVVKPFCCLDEVHRGIEDKCKQQCDYCERHY